MVIKKHTVTWRDLARAQFQLLETDGILPAEEVREAHWGSVEYFDASQRCQKLGFGWAADLLYTIGEMQRGVEILKGKKA